MRNCIPKAVFNKLKKNGNPKKNTFKWDPHYRTMLTPIISACDLRITLSNGTPIMKLLRKTENAWEPK